MSLRNPANENVTEQNKNGIITQGPIRPNVGEYPCHWTAKFAFSVRLIQPSLSCIVKYIVLFSHSSAVC